LLTTTSTEGVDRGLHGRLRGGGIGDVERDRAHAVAVLGDEVVELPRRARGGDEPMAGGQDGLRDRAAEAAGAAGDEEDLRGGRHDARFRGGLTTAN